MYYYMAKGSVKHIILAKDIVKYICNNFDTDLMNIDIYNYTKNKQSLYRLVAECNGKNIQTTKEVLDLELGLDKAELKYFERNGYVFIYEGLKYEQIMYWYGYLQSKNSLSCKKNMV